MQVIKCIADDELKIPVIASGAFFKAMGATEYGYLKEGDAVLPFYIKRKYFFQFMAFTSGVLGCKNKEEEEFFLKDALVYIQKNLRIDFILPIHITALFYSVPDFAIACPFGSYVLDLNKTEEELFGGLHSKHRNVIRKAEKDGIKATVGNENFNACIALIKETMLRQGKSAASDTYFSSLKESLKDQVDFWLAKDADGKVQGSAVLAWKRGSVAYYLYGGSCAHPLTGAVNFLHWEAIKKMKERGVKAYDFVGARIHPEEGSKYEGIQRFKGRFGGELKEGFMWKFIFNKFKYRLFCSCFRLKGIFTHIPYQKDIVEQEIRRLNIQ